MMKYLWILVILSATTSAFGQNAYGPDYLNLHCTTPDSRSNTLFGIPPQAGLVPNTSANGNLVVYCDSTAGALKASVNGGAYNNVAGGSGGTVSNPAAPVMAYYFTNACPTSNTGQCFFTPSNTQIANDCTWSTSSTTLTCASSHFASTDVGKRISGYFKTDTFGSIFGCVAGRVSFSAMTTGVLTISTFVSGTQITVSANPSNPATGNNGCVIWGTPDDSNASAFETAYSAVTSFCPKVMLAAAGYWFSSPHFSTQPAGCSALPSLVGATAFGNQVYTAGFELEGRGPGNTVIYLGPDFPNGDTCLRSEAGITNACFLVPVEGKWSDFQITGGGQLSCQVPANRILIGVAVGTMQNITLTNFCQTPQSSGWIGIEADLLSQLYQVNNSGWGVACFQNVATTGGEIQAFKLACENSPGGAGTPLGGVNILSTTPFFPTFTCFGCLLLGAIASPSGMQVVDVAAGAEVHLIGTVINTCEAGAGCTSSGVNMLLNKGGTVYLTDVNMVAQGGASSSGIGCNVSGGKTYLERTNLSNNGGQNYFDNGNCTLFDLGGNGPLFTGLAGGANMIGSLVADGRSQMFSCTGAVNASVTNSLYGTGPNVTSTTCAGQTATLGTGIPFQQARTISGVICTSSATTVSVACTVMINAVAASTTCTMTAATRCSNFTTTAVNPGDLLSARIVTGAAETGANIKMQVFWQ